MSNDLPCLRSCPWVHPKQKATRNLNSAILSRCPDENIILVHSLEKVQPVMIYRPKVLEKTHSAYYIYLLIYEHKNSNLSMLDRIREPCCSELSLITRTVPELWQERVPGWDKCLVVYRCSPTAIQHLTKVCTVPALCRVELRFERVQVVRSPLSNVSVVTAQEKVHFELIFILNRMS